MIEKTPLRRSCGILLHISSLPGPFGIGQLGRQAFSFLNFLQKAGQTIWQFLPLGPVDATTMYSPYMSSSAFAGNPLFISPKILVEDGLLSPDDLKDFPSLSEYLVDYEKLVPLMGKLLKKAHAKFKKGAGSTAFQEFCRSNSFWLDDYCLFAALKQYYDGKAWNQWPDEVARRKKEALESARKKFAESIDYNRFVQWQFFKQWQGLKRAAEEKGIKFFGDMPIYVAPDSADVWTNQDCFELDPNTLKPTFIAGVPPDYFSKTGQRWGNPIYKWKIDGRPNEALYKWWERRLKFTSQFMHMVRIDHFRGLQAFWKIPAWEKTAVNGKWVRGPGRYFFERLHSAVEKLEIVAEDLGTITRPVIRLRDELGLAGMKVLIFAFDSDEHNLYLPHNYEHRNFVVYTGTHDNNTVVGWYLDPRVGDYAKERARRYANSDGNRIHWDFLRIAYSSIARIAIIPMQDVLGFGSDCRMNLPASTKGNWRWRLAERFLTRDVAENLRSEAKFYARLPVKISSAKAQ